MAVNTRFDSPGNDAIPAARAMKLSELVQCAPGAIVSRVLAKNDAGTLTLFAFDEGQGLSEHTAPFDALVQVIEGALDLVIGGEQVRTSAGELTLMPANVPHGLNAPVKTKMLLTMLREKK